MTTDPKATAERMLALHARKDLGGALEIEEYELALHSLAPLLARSVLELLEERERLDFLEALLRSNGYPFQFSREGDWKDGHRGGPDWAILTVNIGAGPYQKAHRGPVTLRSVIDTARKTI